MSICAQLNAERLVVSLVVGLLVMTVVTWIVVHILNCAKSKSILPLLSYPLFPWFTGHLFLIKGHGSSETYFFVFLFLVIPGTILLALGMAIHVYICFGTRKRLLRFFLALYVLAIPPLQFFWTPISFRTEIIEACRSAEWQPI